MINVASIAAICVICAVLCRIFENGSREYGLALTVVVCVGAFASILAFLGPVLEMLESFLDSAQIADEPFVLLFKAVGICIITQLAADVCRDCRETAMASAVETAGRAAVLLLSVPVFTEAGGLILKIAGV